MTFGMILLLLIAACSVAGSLIPQQREAMEYVARYGAAGSCIKFSILNFKIYICLEILDF